MLNQHSVKNISPEEADPRRLGEDLVVSERAVAAAHQVEHAGVGVVVGGQHPAGAVQALQGCVTQCADIIKLSSTCLQLEGAGEIIRRPEGELALGVAGEARAEQQVLVSDPHHLRDK